MKEKEDNKCQTCVMMKSSKSKTRKSAWDIAQEWQSLGKDRIRKMQKEKVSVSH